MTIIAIVLLVISAIVHASWNLIGKHADAGPQYFLQTDCFGWMILGICISPYLGLAKQFPHEVWVCIFLTGCFEALYYWGLARGYSVGQLSVMYPLSRSIPVVLVLLVNIIIGRVHQLSVQAIIGMILVAVGGLLLPITKWDEWKLKNYIKPVSVFALVAALGTTGYSIIDDHALRAIHGSLDAVAPKTALTLVYTVLVGVSSSSWLFTSLVLTRQFKFCVGGPINWRGIGTCAIAGIGVFLAYGLVLVAMGYSRNISYVVAFRQLGIPIGALMGVFILKEPIHPPKMVGIIVMLLGLVMVALR